MAAARMTAPDARAAVVIGAGFAGLAAAVELAEAGWRVTALEKAPRLGGRASSFLDRASGEPCDNGQHLLIAGMAVISLEILYVVVREDRRVRAGDSSPDG